MVNTLPLKKYIESRDALTAGDEERALSLLAESLGAKEPTDYMRAAIKTITEPNMAILAIILHESKG